MLISNYLYILRNGILFLFYFIQFTDPPRQSKGWVSAWEAGGKPPDLFVYYKLHNNVTNVVLVSSLSKASN